MPQADPPPSTLNHVRTGPRGGGTVLLLHSAGLDLTYWDRQIEALSPDYDVVAVDLRGHGRSAGPPPVWTFEAEAAELAETIGGLGVGPVHVVGVSYGSMAAQWLAVTAPGWVRSLTLIGAAATFNDPARAALRARGAAVAAGGMAAALGSIAGWLSAETRARRPDLVERITKTLLADDAAAYAGLWPRVAGLDLLGRLAGVRCPTLAVVCEADASTPPAAAAAMVERIAGARRVVLPGGAHLAHLEAPAAVNATLREFLATVA